MALDEKGIYLSEVTHKYPKSFQTLGYDVLLDTDSMYKPKVISTFEMCINTILTLLFMKPGQYPSIPTLGIDIDSYLYEYADDPNIPSKIKNDLQDQCNRLSVIGIDIDVYIDQTEDGTNALVIKVTGTDKLGYGSQSNRVIIGITHDKLNRLYVRKTYV